MDGSRETRVSERMNLGIEPILFVVMLVDTPSLALHAGGMIGVSLAVGGRHRNRRRQGRGGSWSPARDNKA